ncbi:SLAP domain-containing protein [Oceanobacillus bengalensis]|uniref:SLAP domain-containing protein n=1 Tax=Oceanobacillus bengalensis TaxID=1435466 RepID=A0A494YZB3_9BACI|nr:SLAP domain-containing protein [Oceanobacillus bengalensis]RKQ15579.1 SLAP domain-containing protein [Oceanobacillus bengalensis]
MTQTLVFESAWDRTIAKIDRERIQNIFQDTSRSLHLSIQFTTLTIARNYKGELLVTVLIHNPTNDDLAFYEKEIYFTANGKTIAKHTFTHPSLLVKQKTSMPWTFIFPVGSFNDEDKIEDGVLAIV